VKKLHYDPSEPRGALAARYTTWKFNSGKKNVKFSLCVIKQRRVMLCWGEVTYYLHVMGVSGQVYIPAAGGKSYR
jgi:hypothetical protein